MPSVVAFFSQRANTRCPDLVGFNARYRRNANRCPRSRHTPFHTVKVVIVGQDPYHNHNQAHGLAFSVRPPTPAPPSLKNMYIALKNDYPDFTPPPNRGGLLTPWADRGVLMLNTCLTVRAHDPKSHGTRGWERLTQRAIDLVAARRTRGVVFMAWGTPAGMCVKKVDAKKNLVLRAVHPSPLSASRGFFTCGHFKKANEWLVGKYGAGSEVDWSLGPRQAKIEFGAVKKEEAVKGDDEAEKKVSKVEAAAGVKTDVVETAEAKKAEVETPAAVEEKPEAVAGTSVAKTDAAAAKPDTRVEATSATKRVTRAETAATKFVKTDSAAKDVDDVKKLVTDASKDEDKENKKVEVGE